MDVKGLNRRKTSDLKRLTTPRFTLIAEAIRSDQWDEALVLAEEATNEHEWAHDGFRNAVARSLTIVANTYGQPAVEKLGYGALDETFVQMHEMYDQMDIRDQIKTAAAGWHWHMTKFRLAEDNDKVTFLLEPCGSGGRLINEGMYYGTRKNPLALVPDATPNTFSEPNFPVYCNHCSELSGIGLKMGAYGFLMEGWTKAHRHGACRQHAFKRLSSLPDEYFERMGVDRNAVKEKHPDRNVPNRVFTDQEMLEIATPPIERLKEALIARDRARSNEINEECILGWGTVIHDVYRDWITALYDGALKLHGEPFLHKNQGESAWEFFGPILRDTSELSGEDRLMAWATLWRSHGAVQAIQTVDGGWTLEIEPRRLLNAATAQRFPGDWVASFCQAVNHGLEQEQKSHLFGKLTSKNSKILHHLPAGNSQQ